MMTITPLEYNAVKEKSVEGRYVTLDGIALFLQNISSAFTLEKVGKSVRQKPIFGITLGTGSHKILMWSQMHGNESTTTKAVLDFLNFLNSDTDAAKKILEECTLKVLPILNPDGAEAYTRVNANGIDLNRDAQDLTQPESRALREVYDDFRPDFCFNLHDQRTIFNVGGTAKPATISFLAPAHDEERSISPTRATSMRLIVAINTLLQKLIPGQVGRYDDSFNANCVGDTFQMLNTPTLLFEAGHFAGDYQRERTRELIFKALLTAVATIAEDCVSRYPQTGYFAIPENEKCFYDVLIKNADVVKATLKKKSDMALQYQEILRDNAIVFDPKIEKVGNLDGFFGHNTYDCLDTDDVTKLKNQSYGSLIFD